MDADNNLEGSGLEDLEEVKTLSKYVKSGALEVLVFGNVFYVIPNIDRLASRYNDSKGSVRQTP